MIIHKVKRRKNYHVSESIKYRKAIKENLLFVKIIKQATKSWSL